jgi:hypothetical protein
MCVLIFSITFFSETFLLLRRIQRDAIINIHMSSYKVPCHVLTKLEFARQIVEKSSKIKFHKIRPMGAELFHTDGQT